MNGVKRMVHDLQMFGTSRKVIKFSTIILQIVLFLKQVIFWFFLLFSLITFISFWFIGINGIISNISIFIYIVIFFTGLMILLILILFFVGYISIYNKKR